MKLKLKIIAAAAVMAAASGAQADLVTNFAGNSSLALVAFNVLSNSYYVRDLGFTLNSFLPNSVTTTAADGGGSAVIGNKTPEAGLNISFAAGNFVSWLGSQDTAQIRWTIAAGDGSVAGAPVDFNRALVASSQGPLLATNTTIRAASNTNNGVSGLASTNPTFGYDATGATIAPGFLSNNGFGASTLNLLNGAASLYYYVTTASTGASSTTSAPKTFSNSLNTATLTLASTGVLTYDLQPAAVSAVPVPAAAWLLGSGLLGIGGMIRRRKAAAAAA